MRLVLILLLTAGLAAQEQKPVPESPPQQPIFRAGTDLVRVDVTVTANGDKPVADLTLEDFEVTDDGVPQTVETLKFIQVDGTRQSNLDEPLEKTRRALGFVSERDDTGVRQLPKRDQSAVSAVDGVQVHVGPPMTVEYRNILLKEL